MKERRRVLAQLRRIARSLEEGSTAMEVVAAERRRDPWAVLAGTLLSLRTRDEVTGPATARLLERAPDPRSVLALSARTIERIIRPVGFAPTKARRLRAIARLLVERHGGEVPPDRDALLALPGVGRKTANLVLGLAFGVPAICVDTHVHRIPNRLGWIRTRDPAETERALERLLPRSWWIRVNGVLVAFGQRTCKPLSPHCSRCPVGESCPRRGVGRHR